MVFSASGPGSTTEAVTDFEASLRAHGALKNEDKDVDDVLTETCVGVDLVDGTHWRAPASRLWALLDAILDLVEHGRGSPGGVAAYLGVAQWYDLLRRLRLSVFDRVYDFSSGAKARDWRLTEVPDAVVDELLVDMTLSVFGAVDMQRPFLPFVGATDASTVFGHGAAIAPLPLGVLRRLSTMTCTAGGHVTLDDGAALSEELAARLGPRQHLDLQLGDFEVVLSVRVEDPDHINLEEAKALIRYIRWILRSKSRFGHRVVVLIDSQVVIGAATKGRSSSRALNALIRRLAALCFAGGLVLHCIFIPTAHNPSDWPSRGGPGTWPEALRSSTRRGVPGGPRAEARAPKHAPTAAERAAQQLDVAWLRLVSCGMVDSDSSSCNSTDVTDDDIW